MNDHSARLSNNRITFLWNNLDTIQVYIDNTSVATFKGGVYTATPVRLISVSSATWGSVSVDLSPYNNIIVSTCTRNYRALASSFMTRYDFMNVCKDTNNTMGATYGGEPQYYSGQAYYSGGKLYAIARGTYDLTVVQAF